MPSTNPVEKDAILTLATKYGIGREDLLCTSKLHQILTLANMKMTNSVDEMSLCSEDVDTVVALAEAKLGAGGKLIALVQWIRPSCSLRLAVPAPPWCH